MTLLTKPHNVFEWGKQFSHTFDLSAHRCILDIGCRQGELSASLAQRYPNQHFIAIDNLASEIEIARNQRCANLEFQTQDALSLPYIEEFDAIVSFNCLLWIKNKKEALRKIRDALKPKGKAYFQFFVSHQYPKNDRFLYQIASTLKWQDYFRKYQPHYYEISLPECCRLLEACGFSLNQLKMVKYPYTINSPDKLLQLFQSWSSHMHYLPKNKHEHFLNEVVTTYYQAHQLCENDAFDYHEYLVEIVCEKAQIDNSHLPYKFTQYALSLKEVQVLKHTLSGKSAKEIATLLKLSAKTIEFHLAKIKIKLNCHKRSDIFQKAVEEDFINIMFDDHL